MKCKTAICRGEVIPVQDANWIEEQYCKYIEGLCPVCHMTYWIVNRNNKIGLKDRRLDEPFDHRKKDGPR